MGELTIFEKIREFIGEIAFKIFLWSVNMTQDQYINSIVEQEIADWKLKYIDVCEKKDLLEGKDE